MTVVAVPVLSLMVSVSADSGSFSGVELTLGFAIALGSSGGIPLCFGCNDSGDVSVSMAADFSSRVAGVV